MTWTKEEDVLLKKIYETQDIQIIKKSFNRTWDAIKIRANNLGLYRIDRNSEQRIGDVSILLSDTPISYYWIGFILADGSIDHKSKRLKIGLAIKDKEHLEKFCHHIKTNIKEKNDTKQCYCAIQDKIIIDKIINKFDFKSNKTINPPTIDFSSMNNNLFISLLCGFIDGDGCIAKVYKRQDSVLRIKIHSSWIIFLESIKIKLEKILQVKVNSPKIINSGYALLSITNIQTLRLLKNEIKKLNIPYLERKWNNIDENLISRYEKTKKQNKIIYDLLNEGVKKSIIAKQLNISPSTISNLLKRNPIY